MDTVKNITIATELASEIAGLYERLRLLNQQREKIQGLLSQLIDSPELQSEPVISSHADSSTFKQEWSWTEKIRFVLKREQKCLNAKEILNLILTIEASPSKDKEDIEKSYRQLSSAISAKISIKKVFGRYKPESDAEYKVGLIEWFESEGKVKDEFRNDHVEKELPKRVAQSSLS